MAISKQHRILIASDGSPSAQAALATAVKFPWSASSRVRTVIARSTWLPANSPQSRAAVEKSFQDAADAARRVLKGRWPESKAVFLDAPPEDAILADAERFRASLIVLGWRGHGTFRRLLAGSVSRSIAARASCPVLVVRETARAVRRFVVGFDGCPNAERAIEFLSSLEPGRGGSVVLVNVIQPVSAPPSVGSLPASIRATIYREVAALNKEQHQQGQAAVAAAASRLQAAGWTAKGEVRPGATLASLMKAVKEHGADVLVLGARATSGLERALLGSVANGALDRSPVPVLLVR